MKNKRGLGIESLLPWIIFILVLILVFISYAILSGKAQSAIEYLKVIISK